MIQLRRPGFIALGLILVLLAAACTAPSANRGPANDAWSQRLTQQAESIRQRQERADHALAAWAGRLQAQAAADAGGQARAERAQRAWADRLTAQAASYGASR